MVPQSGITKEVMARMGETNPQADIRRILDAIREHVQGMVGPEAVPSFQIAALVHILANRYDNLHTSQEGECSLSGPRIGVLIRLLEEERRGNLEGITPTALSQNQNVTRNTISALLRGLEDQQLIERSLDPDDRRLFRIRLSEVGRKTITALAPRRIEMMTRLAASLTPAEQAQLIQLMAKLYDSLQAEPGCPASLAWTAPSTASADEPTAEPDSAVQTSPTQTR
jgi:DNA-binding MarR family transcriptional regulator